MVEFRKWYITYNHKQPLFHIETKTRFIPLISFMDGDYSSVADTDDIKFIPYSRRGIQSIVGQSANVSSKRHRYERVFAIFVDRYGRTKRIQVPSGEKIINYVISNGVVFSYIDVGAPTLLVAAAAPNSVMKEKDKFYERIPISHCKVLVSKEFYSPEHRYVYRNINRLFKDIGITEEYIVNLPGTIEEYLSSYSEGVILPPERGNSIFDRINNLDFLNKIVKEEYEKEQAEIRRREEERIEQYRREGDIAMEERRRRLEAEMEERRLREEQRQARRTTRRREPVIIDDTEEPSPIPTVSPTVLQQISAYTSVTGASVEEAINGLGIPRGRIMEIPSPTISFNYNYHNNYNIGIDPYRTDMDSPAVVQTITDQHETINLSGILINGRYYVDRAAVLEATGDRTIIREGEPLVSEYTPTLTVDQMQQTVSRLSSYFRPDTTPEPDLPF